MKLPGIPLAERAAREFTRRREAARRKVGAGELDPATAEAHLRPWAALALRCGADPGALAPDGAMADVAWNLEALRATRTIEGDRPAFTEHQARAIVADDLCPTSGLRQALAAARDAAVDRAMAEPTDPQRGARAHDLTVLAVAMGVSAREFPQQERKAA